MSKLPRTILIACRKLGLEPNEVIEHKDYGNRIVVITTSYAKMTIELGELDLEEEPPTTLENQPTPGLTKLTVAELRAVAKSQEIDGYSRMRKADLIKALGDVS